MIARYQHSRLARFIAGGSLVASIVGTASWASAVTCTFPFPTAPIGCSSGTSNALVSHDFDVPSGQFAIGVDWRGGVAGAIAYGIDINGNHLNNCAQTVADDDVSVEDSAVSCLSLYGVEGTAPPSRRYDHIFDMASTFVIVL